MNIKTPRNIAILIGASLVVSYIAVELVAQGIFHNAEDVEAPEYHGYFAPKKTRTKGEMVAVTVSYNATLREDGLVPMTFSQDVEYITLDKRARYGNDVHPGGTVAIASCYEEINQRLTELNDIVAHGLTKILKKNYSARDDVGGISSNEFDESMSLLSDRDALIEKRSACILSNKTGQAVVVKLIKKTNIKAGEVFGMMVTKDYKRVLAVVIENPEEADINYLKESRSVVVVSESHQIDGQVVSVVKGNERLEATVVMYSDEQSVSIKPNTVVKIVLAQVQRMAYGKYLAEKSTQKRELKVLY